MLICRLIHIKKSGECLREVHTVSYPKCHTMLGLVLGGGGSEETVFLVLLEGLSRESTCMAPRNFLVSRPLNLLEM